MKKILTGHNNLVQSVAFSHKYSFLVSIVALIYTYAICNSI